MPTSLFDIQNAKREATLHKPACSVCARLRGDQLFVSGAVI
jgi:hypothetical protein